MNLRKWKIQEMRLQKIIFLLSMVIAFTGILGPSWGLASGIEAITKPSADVTLAFPREGRVAEVLVKQGDLVQKGQVLAQLDDSAEQIQLEQLKAKADQMVKVKAAAAELAQKREDLKKLQWAKQKNAATDWEVEHARLAVEISAADLDLARFEHHQDSLRYQQDKAEVERFKIRSPISGRVELVDIEPGESPKPLTTVLRVVKSDPLWIDVAVPMDQTYTLKQGQAVTILFPAPDEHEQPHAKGKVIYISGVADAASNTLPVRIEVPNPMNRPAGEHVFVVFDQSAEQKIKSKPSTITRSNK